jgi:hypothetical protein
MGSVKSIRIDSDDNAFIVLGNGMSSFVVKLDADGGEVWKTGLFE